MVYGLRVILTKAQKVKEESHKESIVFLEDTEDVPNRMLVDMWAVQTILMSTQPEMRNVLLGNERKTILVTKFQKWG